MGMKWQYLVLSYLIALAMFAVMLWFTWDWHWGVRVPMLGYLAVCSLIFPLSRIPADMLVLSVALWSPVMLTGLLAWVPQGLTYVVVWALGPIFAPIGALMHVAARRRTSS